MALDLKSRHVHELARELADLTGDTMTGAVEVALREATFVLDAIAADPGPCLSAGTLLEARMVMQARYGDEGVRDLDLLLQAAQATVVPVSGDQVDVAIEGFRRFGLGRRGSPGG